MREDYAVVIRPLSRVSKNPSSIFTVPKEDLSKSFIDLCFKSLKNIKERIVSIVKMQKKGSLRIC